jgi:hypothetical protein
MKVGWNATNVAVHKATAEGKVADSHAAFW